MRQLLPALACGLFVLLHPALASNRPNVESTYATPQTINHGGKIETKYDGITSETVIRLRKMKVECSAFRENFDYKNYCVSIDVTLHCPGTQLSFVRNVSLQVIFDTKDWTLRHPYDQRELSVVADGETYRFGRMELITRKDEGMRENLIETLEATIPYKTFKKIAAAETVHLQVGKSSVEFRDKNLAALRDLDNRILTPTSAAK
jgi:hypothetical protein